MIYFILLTIICVPILFVLVGLVMSGPRYRGPVTDHFDGKKFKNPTGIEAKGTKDLFKWMFNRKRGAWREKLNGTYGARPLLREKDNLRITFINHSTFLIQVDNLNIITDPIYSRRTSPFDWAGPKRMRLPGIRFEDLPRIDVVLLTHNHYDHLDLPTIRTLFGAHHPQIVTPLGVKAFLDRQGIIGATDMDWWQELAINEKVAVTSVPAQHFSGRGAFDRDATLWCGYVIKTSKGTLYVAGDTGYNSETFKQIGAKLGPMRASFLPIGAYKPRWFMSPIHTSPEEAVLIHQEVNSQLSIATHFGTFPLADDAQNDPINDLKIALTNHEINESRFVVLSEGDPLIIE